MNNLMKTSWYILILVLVLFVAAGCGGHEPDDDHDHDEAAHQEHQPELEAGHTEDDGHDHSAGVHAGENQVLELSEQRSEEFGIELEQAAGGVLTRRIRLPGEVRLNEDQLVHVVPVCRELCARCEVPWVIMSMPGR